MDTYVRDLADLIEHLDLTELVVIGHSTRGNVVLATPGLPICSIPVRDAGLVRQRTMPKHLAVHRLRHRICRPRRRV